MVGGSLREGSSLQEGEQGGIEGIHVQGLDHTSACAAHQASWPRNQWKLTKGQTRHSGKALLGLLLKQGRERTETGPPDPSLKGDELLPGMG